MSTLFLTREQIAEFSRSGFLVLRSLVDEELVKELLEEISANLEPLRDKLESFGCHVINLDGHWRG